MTTLQVPYRWKCTVAAVILALLPARLRADTARTGDEPWYREPSLEQQQQARALFEQAVVKHQQLLRDQARELYEQALTSWDNPDIRWNLALLLEDLGQYLRAYQQLDGELRWGDALGAESLQDVRDRMQALETRRLAWIEASSDEPGADITLDGQHWFTGATRQRKLVDPGTHYVAARKAGYFPLTRTVSVSAGQKASVQLPMDADRLLETRRWSAWKPWIVVSAGIVVAAAGAGLEGLAFANRGAAAKALRSLCEPPSGCTPARSSDVYDRAVVENRLAIGALLAGGTTMAVGLTLAWLNQVHTHHTEARAPAPIELMPLLLSEQVGVSVRFRF